MMTRAAGLLGVDSGGVWDLEFSYILTHAVAHATRLATCLGKGRKD